MNKKRIIILMSTILLCATMTACQGASSSSEESHPSSELPPSIEQNDDNLIRPFTMNYSNGEKDLSGDDTSLFQKIDVDSEIILEVCKNYKLVFELPIEEDTDNEKRDDYIDLSYDDKKLELKKDIAITKDLISYTMIPLDLTENKMDFRVTYYSSKDAAMGKEYKFYYTNIDYKFNENNIKAATEEDLVASPAFKEIVTTLKDQKFQLPYKGILDAQNLYNNEVKEGTWTYDFNQHKDDPDANPYLVYDLNYTKYLIDDCVIPTKMSFPYQNKFSFAGATMSFDKVEQVRPLKVTKEVMNAFNLFYVNLDPADILTRIGNALVYTATPLDSVYEGGSLVRPEINYSMLHNEYYLLAKRYPEMFYNFENENGIKISILNIDGQLFGTFDRGNYSYQLASIEVTPNDITKK